MANDQNTYAGTTGGANIISTLGNEILDAFAQISNVGVNVTTSAGSLLDSVGVLKQKYYNVVKSNKTTAPQQSTPFYQISNVQDYFSDPARVKQALFYVAGFSLIAIGTIYIAKKL